MLLLSVEIHSALIAVSVSVDWVALLCFLLAAVMVSPLILYWHPHGLQATPGPGTPPTQSASASNKEEGWRIMGFPLSARNTQPQSGSEHRRARSGPMVYGRVVRVLGHGRLSRARCEIVLAIRDQVRRGASCKASSGGRRVQWE